MELILVVAVLCLAASTSVLASAVPFIWWKCFRLESRLREEITDLQGKIATLDETLAQLLENVGIPSGETR